MSGSFYFCSGLRKIILAFTTSVGGWFLWCAFGLIFSSPFSFSTSQTCGIWNYIDHAHIYGDGDNCYFKRGSDPHWIATSGLNWFNDPGFCMSYASINDGLSASGRLIIGLVTSGWAGTKKIVITRCRWWLKIYWIGSRGNRPN